MSATDSFPKVSRGETRHFSLVTTFPLELFKTLFTNISSHRGSHFNIFSMMWLAILQNSCYVATNVLLYIIFNIMLRKLQYDDVYVPTTSVHVYCSSTTSGHRLRSCYNPMLPLSTERIVLLGAVLLLSGRYAGRSGEGHLTRARGEQGRVPKGQASKLMPLEKRRGWLLAGSAPWQYLHSCRYYPLKCA